MKKIYLWAREKVNSPSGTYVFAFCNFIEAVLFMPVNTLLLVYGIEAPNRAFNYATIAVFASCAGAVVGYGLGVTFRLMELNQWLYYFMTPDGFAQCGTWCEHNEIAAVFLGSLLPVPFKVITILSGFMRLPFLIFIASATAARIVRFFSIAIALHLWGPYIQELVDRYFYLALTILIVFLGLTIYYVLH